MPAETEARRIALGSRTLVYTLERKRVKNINLRVRPDGSVYVSCPYLTSVGRVEDQHVDVVQVEAFVDAGCQQQGCYQEFDVKCCSVHTVIVD